MIWDYNKKFFKYFIEDKKALYKYFGLSFIVGILELFGVALTYPFITRLMSKDGLDSTSIFWGCLIIIAFFAKNIFMIFYNYLQADFTKTCESDINKKFMKFFIQGDYSNISQIPFAKKLQIVGFLTPSVINNYLVRLLNLNVNIFIFVLLIAFLFAKFFIATSITLLSSLILLFLQALFFKHKTGKVSKLINQANENLNQSINEPILNIKSVKIFNSEKFFYEKYTQKLEVFRKLAKDLLFYNSIPAYVTEPFIILILLLLLAIISIQNLSNSTALIASYAVIVSAVFRLAPTISRIQVNLTGINTSTPQVKELIKYYEEFALNDFVPKKDIDYSFNSTIELKDVCFKYGEKEVLKNINLTIKKGEFIGIAGHSGVGKTTLVDILAGLLKIRTGQIYIDGKLIPGIEMPKLKIGYIPQDYSIISSSIRENVAFGHDAIDDEQVIKVLKQAQLYEFVEKNFEEGIYAKPFVDSNGLSQGQKQRLAIARALYLDPDIIILDEATSSLDLKTEDEICEVLNKLKGEKTIITIAHRLSTLKNADIIHILENSTITDSGDFEELFKRNDRFKKLVELNNSNSIH